MLEYLLLIYTVYTNLYIFTASGQKTLWVIYWIYIYLFCSYQVPSPCNQVTGFYLSENLPLDYVTFVQNIFSKQE